MVTTEKSNIKSSATNTPDNAVPENFEAGYAELEQIVASMASNDVSLQDSLTAYTRGHFLLQFCQQSLADVEQQVQLLNAQNVLAPFDLKQD